jgi:hypothetical protein
LSTSIAVAVAAATVVVVAAPTAVTVAVVIATITVKLLQAMPWEDKEVHSSWDKIINLTKFCAVLHMASAPPNYQREFGGMFNNVLIPK